LLLSASFHLSRSFGSLGSGHVFSLHLLHADLLFVLGSTLLLELLSLLAFLCLGFDLLALLLSSLLLSALTQDHLLFLLLLS